jgi:hypothetical protein
MELERVVSSSIDSVASSCTVGVKKLRNTVPPHLEQGSSFGGLLVKNISLPHVMQTSVSIPSGPFDLESCVDAIVRSPGKMAAQIAKRAPPFLVICRT